MKFRKFLNENASLQLNLCLRCNKVNQDFQHGHLLNQSLYYPFAGPKAII